MVFVVFREIRLLEFGSVLHVANVVLAQISCKLPNILARSLKYLLDSSVSLFQFIVGPWHSLRRPISHVPHFKIKVSSLPSPPTPCWSPDV